MTGVRVDDCWNRIGVRGDRSCPELVEHVHCRNCPIYSAGAADLLDAEVPAGHLAERTSHFAEPARGDSGEMRSVVIFRVAAEWLALPTALVVEVANLLPIHSLPHRSNGAVLGVTSVAASCWSAFRPLRSWARRGRLAASPRAAYPRLLVVRRVGPRRLPGLTRSTASTAFTRGS